MPKKREPPVQVGVIGTGAMGRNHARIYSELDLLGGVFDITPSSSMEMSRRHGVENFRSIDDMLQNVDAVSVCTPTSTHYQNAKMAIEAGIPVLVEKPFTGDVEVATELCDLAEEQDVTIAIGMVERFNPVVEEAKNRLSSGAFGDLVTISSRRVSSFPERVRDVGVIMDLGIHDVDALTYITGSKVRSVFTAGGVFNGSGFEDHATIMMKMEDGNSAVAEVNWLTPMKVRRVYMTCSKAYAQLDYMEQMISVSSSKYVGNDDSNLYEPPWEFDYRETYLKKQEPLKRELEDFVNAVQEGRDPLVPGREALENLRVCKAALLSLNENRQVSLIDL